MKKHAARARYLFAKVIDDRLFLLSSSVSYYSALSLAPFLLIILAAASLLRTDTQSQIVTFATKSFSPEVGETFLMVFENAQKASMGSFTGVIGTLILLFTASIVFTQLRYSFDVIYGYHDPNDEMNFWEWVSEKLFAVLVVIGAAALVILTFSIATAAEFFIYSGNPQISRVQVLLINFSIYVLMFTGVHTFTPSHRPPIKQAFKIAFLSSLFFMLGNFFLAEYLRNVASHSVYGAAGTLFIFLVWVFYSSFTLFLSVEVFLYLRKIGSI
jgi:membrane protein